MNKKLTISATGEKIPFPPAVHGSIINRGGGGAGHYTCSYEEVGLKIVTLPQIGAQKIVILPLEWTLFLFHLFCFQSFVCCLGLCFG